MSEVHDPNMWENGGNVVSLDAKRREYAAKKAEEEAEDYDIAVMGTFMSSPGDFLPLRCDGCGSEDIVVLSDGDLVTAECSHCGDPMLEPLIRFLRGED